MMGDDLLTRKASSINMRCVSASRRVRIRRQARGSEGIDLSSCGLGCRLLLWLCWVTGLWYRSIGTG